MIVYISSQLLIVEAITSPRVRGVQVTSNMVDDVFNAPEQQRDTRQLRLGFDLKTKLRRESKY